MKNKSPLLSVLIPNYNYAQYLSQCLDSVLSQTYPNLEIIVSDDGSTDDSPTIIREYETRYPGKVKGFFLAGHQGLPANRDTAIAQAQGDYITTLDSDDYYYDPRKLEAEMSLVLQYKKEKDQDIVAFSDIMLVTAAGQPLGAQWPAAEIRQGMIFEDILTRSGMMPRNSLAGRTVYLECGYYRPEFKSYRDWDMTIRMAARYHFYFTGLTGVAYRQHGTGASIIVGPGQKTSDLWAIFCHNLPLTGDKSHRKTLIDRFLVFMARWQAQIDQHITNLQQICDERLQLIEELHQVAQERLELISGLDAKLNQPKITLATLSAKLLKRK